ncbi:MAG: hypothetical protein ACRERX_21770 [Pseudomonas sp.]
MSNAQPGGPAAPMGQHVATDRTPHAATQAAQPAGLASVLLYRLLGAVLIMLLALPIYRLLDRGDTGTFGASTIRFTDVYYEFMWLGILLVVPVALLAGRYLPAERVERATSAAARWLTEFRQPGYACTLALVAAGLTALFSLTLLEGKPNFIDSIAQLQHARLWSAGTLAGPVTDAGGFWNLHNMLVTEQGWISQYPPGHVAILALFLRLGIPWAVGPVLVGLSVLCLALFAERIFPERPVVARVSAAFLAISPFFLALGGSYMNHVTSAACVTFGAYALLRAGQAQLRWAYLAGLAFAFAFATRPLSAMVMGVALSLTLRSALAQQPSAHRFRALAWRAALGALPVLTLVFAYNTHFFGGPLASGYALTHGPDMRLGFHRDPWGNMYGAAEALAYTSSDLILLAVNLLETPLPAVAIVGAYFLCSRMSRGEGVIAAWALAPVAANLFYWHHGTFMGPRMLYEAAPAWALLLALAMVRLHEQIGRERVWLRVFHARTTFTAALVVSGIVGAVYLAPQRLNSYGGRWREIMRVPAPHSAQPALVFVHEAWQRRLVAQLVATGMRQHDAETATRQNSSCVLQQLVDAEQAGDRQRAATLRAAVDLRPRATGLPQVIETNPGAPVRVAAGESFTPVCQRHMNSDRYGILDLPPLAWQGDLPGQPARGSFFVRDHGPERNAALLRQFPNHQAFVYTLANIGGEPVLYPYRDGMTRLWGADANW